MAEGEYGVSPLILPGEGYPFVEPTSTHFVIPLDVPVIEKKLTFEEASKCLNTLGKDESGVRYAYLMITATDRKLTDISVILNFKHVLFLDLSGNFLNLDSLQVLKDMPFLIMLKANRNRVQSAALDTIPYLQVLSLNINQIEQTYDIAQPMLDSLNLEFNQIFTAQFESVKLPNLKELDLKGNYLMDLTGVYPESIERLFVAQNKISRLNDLASSKLTNLTTLHLRDNKLRKLNGFSALLLNLRYLNIRNNNVTKLRQFRKLTCLPKLETLVYTGNPVDVKMIKAIQVQGEGASENEDEDEEVFGEDEPLKKTDLNPVRIGLLVILPNLKRINKELVTLVERDEAFFIRDKKMEQIMGEESSDDETEPPTTTYTSEVGDDTETEDEELTPGNAKDDRIDSKSDEEYQ